MICIHHPHKSHDTYVPLNTHIHNYFPMIMFVGPRIQKMNSPMFTLQHSKVQGKQVSAESAFKIYQPIKKVAGKEYVEPLADTSESVLISGEGKAL